MRGGDDLCSLFVGLFDSRQCTENTGVVGNHAVFDRDVKIYPDKNPFARNIYVFYGFFVHRKIKEPTR